MAGFDRVQPMTDGAADLVGDGHPDPIALVE